MPRWYPPGMKATPFETLVESDRGMLDVQTVGAGPSGRLPLTAEMLLERPSGDVSGLTQNAGMGWDPRELGRPQFLMLGTNGGLRAADGRPIALGYHTGHWEIGLLMQAAAEELVAQECLPFAAFCSDPCDGRTQGTVGMMDSLAYRNDAAMVLRRLVRSLPTRKGVLGVATCDKGLPATMMTLAAMRALPVVLVPGGVTHSAIVTAAAIRNAMVVHAAFGGSTNLLLHTPAIAHAAGLRRPTVEDWIAVNRRVPRLVDTLPNGPHPTVRAFLAGGVPE